VNSEPLLLATPSGEELKLCPEGPWIAANVSMLETLSRSVGADVDRSFCISVRDHPYAMKWPAQVVPPEPPLAQAERSTLRHGEWSGTQ